MNNLNDEKNQFKQNIIIIRNKREAINLAKSATPVFEKIFSSVREDEQVVYFEKFIIYSDLLTRTKDNMYRNFPGFKAKQSCIGLGSFLSELGHRLPPRRHGKSSGSPVDRKSLNDTHEVYLVTDCLKWFNRAQTITVHKKLGHQIDEKKYLDVNFAGSQIVKPINVTIAAHGVGVEKDVDFFALRTNLFMEDRFVMVEIKRQGIDKKNESYVYAIRNHDLFEILGNVEDYYIK